MQIRIAKEIQKDVNSFQSEMDLLSQVATQEQHKDSFETYEAQYETLKQSTAKCISILLFRRFQVRLEKVENTLKSSTAAVDQKQFQKAKVSGNIPINIGLYQLY